MSSRAERDLNKRARPIAIILILAFFCGSVEAGAGTLWPTMVVGLWVIFMVWWVASIVRIRRRAPRVHQSAR